MDSSLINAIPSEEIKVEFVRKSTAKSKLKKNPLLLNKGSVVTEVKTKTCTPLPDSFPSPLRICPLVGSSAYHIASVQHKARLKLVHDKGFSGLSELNSAERFNKLINLFQPPLFEVKSTMIELGKQPANEERDEDEQFDEVRRAKTVEGTRRAEIEDMVQILTTKEFQYFTLMNQFKENYLYQTLNDNKVFSQYLSLSKVDSEFFHASDFTARRNKILAQQNKFAQNTYKYHGNLTIK
eukprot:TRINITY_DN11363_c0_g1_i1.p1 TRINITY_DN11363_c0_g1~~TRINITY_DN11363_c0_g1_i1.p1  ORF type:complete len:239 (-),score=52.91 TRINITY_DN11363_c0_g1_i1:507-1223(-)